MGKGTGTINKYDRYLFQKLSEKIHITFSVYYSMCEAKDVGTPSE